MTDETPTELTDDELEGQDPEPLPDRQAMSIITPLPDRPIPLDGVGDEWDADGGGPALQ